MLTRTVHLVVMGVAGCGKSSAGSAIAQRRDLPLVEGGAFHAEHNVDKMARGEPLDDDDRASWLRRLGEQLQARPAGAVLACSALKKKYRDVLRAAVVDLVFVHLSITPEESQRRVGSRAGHFYPSSLVASQFAALEHPAGEPRVLVLDGTAPIEAIVDRVAHWLNAKDGSQDGN